jgi:Tfp pilus assembly protein PilN
MVVALILVIGYSGLSMSITKQISEKKEEVSTAIKKVDSQIAIITEQNNRISAGSKNYEQVVTALTSSDESDDTTSNDATSSVQETEVEIPKNAIPNLLNKIVYSIPTQVKITSIENTTGKHIVIKAQANKYDKLGYFRAVLDTDGILENVKSTSGSKSGETVTITIEGDLP